MTAPRTGGPPVLVLGVSRSGTTLLKEMLDRHSTLAIPSESYFIPQLWDRHGERSPADQVVDDLGRIARVREWGVTLADVRARLPDGAKFTEVIDAVYRAYAEARGKSRYGDKTPSYMQHLALLDRVFPDAQYVHIVRDGRDACLSFLAMKRKPRFNLGRPRRLAEFACAWRLEVEGARRFGEGLGPTRYFELRYEDLVAEPEERLRDMCRFLGLELEPGQLEYHRDVDPTRLQDHPRLAEPPQKDVRRWRAEMSPEGQELFEAVAGGLLARLGYERAFPAPSSAARARAAAELGAFRARLALWNGGLRTFRRSPVWRLRQAYVRRSSPAE
jgi:Sulfotransferase family